MQMCMKCELISMLKREERERGAWQRRRHIGCDQTTWTGPKQWDYGFGISCCNVRQYGNIQHQHYFNDAGGQSARPLSKRQENDKKSEKDKSRDKAKVALTFSAAENTSAQEEGLKAPGGKAAGGTIGKSPRAKFISVRMHDGYSNNPKATVAIPKPPKKKAAGEK
jgi:hypothetical protein